jgi:tetratricopeptide (TPR) repeat protein/KaiC/GvpD/RAD55 family RecA-like ATPase
VYEKTKGNPFFAEEVVKSLKEEDVIFREGNAWKFKNVPKIEFPETVKNVLKTRFSRLDDECQNILTKASFIGNDFAFEALSALTGLEENKLLELMDKLLKTGLVKEREVRGEGIYSFADILIRDVVYEEVSLLKRKKLHGIVGSALEKVYAGKIDEHFGELAYQFLEAGNKEKALDYFLKAAEKAQKIYANNEAASYYQSALRLIEEKEHEFKKRGEILERLGDVECIVGEYDACIKYSNQALLLWEQLGEEEKIAKLHRKMSFALWSALGETEKAERHQERALEILEKGPESVELARVYADMSRLSWHIGNMDKARLRAEKALKLAEKMHASEVIAEANTDLALVFHSAGEPEKAVQCLEKALKIALDNSYMESALRAYNNLGDAVTDEEIERSLELWEKGFELAKKVGHTHWISWMGAVLAGTYRGMGNLNQALQLAEQSVTLDRKTHNLGNLSLSLGSLGFVYWGLGEWDKSEEYLMEALDISKKLNRFQEIARSYANLGDFLLYAKEEPAKAKELFEKACEVCEKAGAKSYKMIFSNGLIASCIELGETEKANDMLEDLQKYAIEMKDKHFISAAHLLRGELFRVQKRWDESIEYFEKGLAEWEALGYKQRNVYDFARLGLYEYARVYLERDREGDRDKARDLLSKTLDMLQKIGAKKDTEKTEAKLVYIETGRITTEPKPADHIPTGYADLDKLLLGGIPSNCSVVLTSPSCGERDMLVRGFLETGAKKGEVTFFVTIDPSAAKPLAEEFQSNFYLFVCNPEASSIVKSTANVFTLKGVENLTDISIALTSATRRLDPSRKGSRRICMGLVSDVLLQHQAVETRRWLTALVTKLKSEKFTMLAVFDPEMHSSQDTRAVLDLFDGEISIYEKETDKGHGKYLRIRRMSNKEYLEDELPLKKEQSKPAASHNY